MTCDPVLVCRQIHSYYEYTTTLKSTMKLSLVAQELEQITILQLEILTIKMFKKFSMIMYLINKIVTSIIQVQYVHTLMGKKTSSLPI